jgi:hypothetical protein
MNPLDTVGLAGHHTVPTQQNSPGFYKQNAIKGTRKNGSGRGTYRYETAVQPIAIGLKISSKTIFQKNKY